MGMSPNARIALYTAVFAGAAIFACPAMTLAAVGGAAVTAAGSLAGNTLAGDIHAAFTRGQLESLHNHHLQQLVGRALAVLIRLHEQGINPPQSGVQKWLPFLHRPHAELSALARAAEEHWDKLILSGPSEQIQDHRVQEAFTDHDRTSGEIYISADEWERHLADLALHAETPGGDPVFMRAEDRRPLADYIAHYFPAAVRELVKADLDPNVGTGGRVFIALHLDMMRAMSISIRTLDEKSDEQLKHLRRIQDGFDALRIEIKSKLDKPQKAEYFDLLDDVRTEVQTTRHVLEGKLDALHEKLDDLGVGMATLLTHAFRDRLSEDELKKRLTEEIERRYAEQFARERNAREAAERAVQGVLDIRDIPGIEASLREKGGQAIVDGLLQKAATSAAAVVESHRKIAEWAYLIGDIEQAHFSLNIILSHLPNDLYAITRMGWIYKLRGDLAAAERQYRKLLDLDPSDTSRAIALGNLGLVARSRGDLDAAERYHKETLEITRRLGRLDLQVNALGNYGLVARIRGDLDAAERYHSESLDIARQLGKLEAQASQLGNLGLVAHTRGDLDVAERFYKESLGMARQICSLTLQASNLGNLGLIALARGDLDAAQYSHSEALSIARKVGSLEGEANNLCNLGSVAKQRGNVADARRLWMESRDLFARVGNLRSVEMVEALIDELAPSR